MTTHENTPKNEASLMRQRGMSLVELLVALVIIGLLAANGFSGMLWAINQAKLSKSVYNVRMVAHAVVQLQASDVDLANGFYRVADIADKLAPFISNLPLTDAWGHPLYVEVYSAAADDDDDGDDDDDDGDDDDDDDDDDGDGTDGLNLGHFRVFSYGKDGTPDAEVVTGVWVDFNSDVVVQDSLFIQTRW